MTAYHGIRHHSAKLNEDSVWRMRLLYRDGRTIKSIAHDFGVGEHAAAAAVYGQTWKRVPMPPKLP